MKVSNVQTEGVADPTDASLHLALIQLEPA